MSGFLCATFNWISIPRMANLMAYCGRLQASAVVLFFSLHLVPKSRDLFITSLRISSMASDKILNTRRVKVAEYS